MFHDEKKTKQYLQNYLIINFLEKYITRKWLRIGNRFLNNGVEVERRLPF